MAQGDVLLFEEFSKQIGDKEHNFTSDVLKLGIVDATLTPAITDASPTWTDYSANEVGVGGGYVAGGLTLANQTYLEVLGIAKLDADDIAIVKNLAGFTDGYWGILYNDTNGTDMAYGFVDLGGPASEVAGDIDINWDVLGIFQTEANPA